MKTLKYTFYLASIFLIILSCKKPTEGFELIISTDFAEATASFQFLDSETGEQLGLDNSADVEVEILGEDASKIVDNAGSSNIEPVQGFLTLATKKGITVSVDDPIEVRMKIKADGYLDQFLTFYMDAKGTQHRLISMQSLNNLSDNVSLKTESIQVDGSGATQSAVSFATPDAQSGTEQIAITVNVPQGTVMKDANGNTVSGNVDAQLVQIAQHNGTTAHSLPNGGTGKVAGETGTFSLESTSFFHLDMFAGGTEVTNFDTPISTTVELNPDTKDINGQPIAAGSEVEVFSFDEANNQYVSEGTAIVSVNANQRFEIDIPMSHLSVWTAAYKVLTCEPENQRQYTLVTQYTFAAEEDEDDFCPNLRFEISNNLGLLLESVNVAPKLGESFKKKVPSGEVEVNVNSLVSDDSTSITFDGTDPCSQLKDAVLVFGQNSLHTVKLTVNAKCASGTIRPNLTCFYREANTTSWGYVGAMVSGQIITNTLRPNVEYEFAVQIGQKFYIGEEKYSFEDDGSTSYDFVFNQEVDPEICALLN